MRKRIGTCSLETSCWSSGIKRISTVVGVQIRFATRIGTTVEVQGFDNLLGQDDKGDVSTETMGPAQTDISAGVQILAERLALLLAYP
ncbi:hypothetical protein V6N13_048759 [Hibiscus sabdariffa]